MSDAPKILFAKGMVTTLVHRVALGVKELAVFLGFGGLHAHVAVRIRQLVAVWHGLEERVTSVAAVQVDQLACRPMGFLSSTAALGGPLHPEHGRGGGSRAPNCAA